jgi:hypothetical protein
MLALRSGQSRQGDGDTARLAGPVTGTPSNHQPMKEGDLSNPYIVTRKKIEQYFQAGSSMMFSPFFTIISCNIYIYIYTVYLIVISRFPVLFYLFLGGPILPTLCWRVTSPTGTPRSSGQNWQEPFLLRSRKINVFEHEAKRSWAAHKVKVSGSLTILLIEDR